MEPNLNSLSIRKLRNLARDKGISLSGLTLKTDIVNKLSGNKHPLLEEHKYNIERKIQELKNKGYYCDPEIMQLYKYCAWMGKNLPFYIYGAEVLGPKGQMVPVELLTSDGIIIDFDNMGPTHKLFYRFNKGEYPTILFRAIPDIPPPPKNPETFEKWYLYQREFIVSEFYA